MFEALDALYPEAQPPESVAGRNPEEAEAPAQRLGGIVETVVDAKAIAALALPLDRSSKEGTLPRGRV